MNEIARLEQEIAERIEKLAALRKAQAGTPVRDYPFETLTGPTTLSRLFGDRSTLIAIHNMGQACRYCTVWADGFNGFLAHLEDAAAVVLLSKDTPHVQRTFASARGWRFQMASHGGGEYIREQTVIQGGGNAPGVVVYRRDGDRILRLNAAPFGPGDLYCALWHVLALAGIGDGDWTPQYSYWKRPTRLEDGGQNVRD
jgi:predicted dithiol-disulfide oxidoreductase (DUF899 family)